MNDELKILSNSKTLNRAIHEVPTFRKKNGNLSSAFFSDSHGVSVDFDNGRSKDEIYVSFCNLFDYIVTGIGVLKITDVQEIDDIKIKYDPVENNKNHAMIIRSDGKLQLSNSQKRKLSKICVEYTKEKLSSPND
jgi:hypothetical protein